MEGDTIARSSAGKRRLEIFRAAEAVDQAVSGMRDGLPAMSAETGKAMAEAREAGSAMGYASYLMFRQVDGFSLIHLWVKPHCTLPRHSHDSDCLYYVASGSIQLGQQTLRIGDGFFVPADALYVYTAGPEGAEVLEIRYGPNKIKTAIPDASAKHWQTALAATQANAAQWRTMDLSPTFAANRAGV